jgi:hypothetical protein
MFCVAACVIVYVALFSLPTTRVEGKIKTVEVVEGSGYTLTVAGDDGNEYKAGFPGGHLALGERCEIRRGSLLSGWEFVGYLPDSSKQSGR